MKEKNLKKVLNISKWVYTFIVSACGVFFIVVLQNMRTGDILKISPNDLLLVLLAFFIFGVFTIVILVALLDTLESKEPKK